MSNTTITNQNSSDFSVLMKKIEENELKPKPLPLTINNNPNISKEIKLKLTHYLHWNETLLPNLRYRIETAFLEIPEHLFNSQKHLTWFFSLLNRIVWWLHYLEQNVTDHPVEREGKQILIELQHLPLLKNAFKHVFNYNFEK